MCMASAEMEVRNDRVPDRKSSSRDANDLAKSGMIVSDYTYFKVQAIERLNRSLSNPKPGKLSAPSVCAIVFLLSAEVGSL